MAFATNARSTVLVQVAQVRPFSDIGGRHVVHLIYDAESRKELAVKLRLAGCDVDESGAYWLNAGDFSTKD